MSSDDFPCLKTKKLPWIFKNGKMMAISTFSTGKSGKMMATFPGRNRKNCHFWEKLPFRWQFCNGGGGGDPGLSLQSSQKRIIYRILYSYKRLKTYRISGIENVAGNLGNLYI